MNRIRRQIIVSFLTGTAFILTWSTTLAARQERSLLSARAEPQVKVIAHRGGSAYAPENTLAALEQAVALGADMAEIDLRMTKDGVPVALHDETLTRTAGLDRPVSEVDSRTLRRLDAGSWFSPDFEGEHIPTLTETLTAAAGRIRLMLELKHTGSDQVLLEQAIEQVRSFGMERECILASANLDLLRRSKELAPEIVTVYIGAKTEPKLWELPYVDGYNLCLSNLTIRDVEQAHRAGRILYTWTVNEQPEMARALAMGVDGLVTDAPGLALELLDRNTT